MIAENKKAPQIRVQLSLSPGHVISIHQEHGYYQGEGIVLAALIVQ